MQIQYNPYQNFLWINRNIHPCWAWRHTPVNPRTREAEAGRPWARGQPGLNTEFQASLGYTVRHCPKPQKSILKFTWNFKGFWVAKRILKKKKKNRKKPHTSWFWNLLQATLIKTCHTRIEKHRHGEEDRNCTNKPSCILSNEFWHWWHFFP
jgi:hypothetical protein